MNQDEFKGFTDEMQDYVNDLVSKAIATNEKTRQHSNLSILVGNDDTPLRIDDLPLLFIGCKLLPNIVNYLVNILPQFIYPYVVAYLQDLSSMRDDPITINELYEFLKDSE